MSKREDIIETAVRTVEDYAADDSHGYDQAQRWGERGDYDCSSLIITAWQLAGVPVKKRGATYTGNMRSVFLACGFADVTGQVELMMGVGLQRGDVLLNERNHTAMYVGNGQMVEASLNERGTTTGGAPGDQTGQEIRKCPYRRYSQGWDCVLRYMGGESASVTQPGATCTVELPMIRRGDKSAAAAAMQAALKFKGYNPVWIDGEVGDMSIKRLKEFQQHNGLDADGVCGKQTWAALVGGTNE